MVYGFFEVNCDTNTIEGLRTALVDVMQKMTVRFAPGPLGAVDWAEDDTRLDASGDDATAGKRLEVFVPTEDPSSVQIVASGLSSIDSVPWFGGTLFHARATGGPWSIRITR
jgi:hypothetical protein